MNMKKISLSFIIGVCMVGSAVAQQIPMYSQYMFNMLNINPAFAGSRGVPTTTMLFRKQWIGMPGAPTSGSVTFDNRIADKNHNWGAQVYFDNIGIEKTNGLQGFYNFNAPFEKATLSLGMSFGVLNYSMDRKRTNPYDQGDPSLQLVVNRFLPTAGFGALLAGERWYVGLSAPALFKTKVMSDGQASIQQAGADGHYFLTAGYSFPVSESLTLKPSTLIKAVSGAPIQVDLNMNAWVNDLIGFGVSYRTSDALVAMLEFRLNNELRLGYGYDHGLSKHLTYNTGTHEFMLRHELGGRQGKKIVSPRFF
jgi:type IX secretion system PorP/SprF family membrane protein